MHPSRTIRGRLSPLLSGRVIVLAVSGSIAAIESPKIARELIRHGADVRAVMSADATRIVTPEALAFATGHPTVTELTGDVEHVTLLGPGDGRADLLLIAPATANTLAKIAHGIDDTPVTSCASVALGGGVPMLVAPAMHGDMGRNPAVRESLDRLRSWGVGIVAPKLEEGEAKLAGPEEVAAAVLQRLARGPWAGRTVVVIGGASREPIDEVRTVSNESSGATAVAIATQAAHRGAAVELWTGSIHVPVPSFVEVVPWRSLADLRSLIRARSATLRRAAAVLVPAALADYTLTPRSGKIPSRENPEIVLRLTRTRKILPELRRAAPPPTRLVGFKLEATGDPSVLAEEARRLVAENRLDVGVANDASAMGSPDTHLIVVTARGTQHHLEGPKWRVAGTLLDEIGRTLDTGAPGPTTAPRPSSRSPPARRVHRGPGRAPTPRR